MAKTRLGLTGAPGRAYGFTSMGPMTAVDRSKVSKVCRQDAKAKVCHGAPVTKSVQSKVAGKTAL